MQRSRQEIVDDGRRHCYLTPPPPCAAWSTALDPRGHSKIQTKMSSDQDLLYEKSKTELSRGPGPENSLSSIHLYRPLLCLCIHLINPDQMSPHLGILFSAFRGFFLLTRHFQQFMLYHCIGATFLSQSMASTQENKPKMSHFKKMGVEMHQVSCINVTRFKLFFIFNHVLNTNARCEFLCQC